MQGAGQWVVVLLAVSGAVRGASAQAWRRGASPDDDPHSVLGIARGATEKEVKAAWKRYARTHHPDRAGGDEAAFIRGSKAYAQLTAPEKQKHSPHGHPFRRQGQQHGGDPFAQWFEQQRRFQQEQFARQRAYLDDFRDQFLSNRQLARLKSGADPRPHLVLFMHTRAHLPREQWDGLTAGLAEAGVVCGVVDPARNGVAPLEDHGVTEAGLRGYFSGRVLVGPALSQHWLKLGHLQRFVLEWLSGGRLLGGAHSAAGFSAALFGVAHRRTVSLNTPPEALAWLQRPADAATAAEGRGLRVLLLLEAEPTEVPRHAAMLFAAAQHHGVAEFAILSASDAVLTAGLCRQHSVASLPAAVVYTAGSALAGGTGGRPSGVKHKATLHARLQRLTAMLDSTPANPEEVRGGSGVSEAWWAAREVAARWGSWGLVAARQNGPLTVLLGMFVVGSLCLQLDALWQWVRPAEPGGATPTHGPTSAEHLHRDDRALLRQLRRIVPSLAPSAVPTQLRPADVVRVVEEAAGNPRHSQPLLVVHLRFGPLLKGGPYAAESVRGGGGGAGNEPEVTLTAGDVVTALAARRLAQLRHLYRFGWMDAAAATEWLGRLPRTVYDAEKEGAGLHADATFLALVLAPDRAALYVGQAPDGVESAQGGKGLARQRDALITFLDRLSDGTEPWVKIRELPDP
eukprot:m.315819 g.315819  ORF g.315819 m.315819 type:complete len:684 (-) comp16414_c1_seq1:165-2216(-)